MAKAQYALDGIPGKNWKISSLMGWRTHPVLKTKKHHNGTDIFGVGKGPFYIEAPYDGKVLKATKSTAAGGGFGNYVVLLHKIDGKHYTTLYAHLKDGSIKVKPGQKVEAGTVLGVMGTSGMSTGVHLHWEMWKGKSHGWTADGKGFVEPVAFFKLQIAKEKLHGTISEATAPDVDADNVPEALAAPKPAPITPAPEKPKTVVKVYTVKSGDTLGKLASRTGYTVAEIASYNKITNVNSIAVGQKIKFPPRG
jgi:murein DD-endopeptidase MepM/ murein hydrolase activator NlpD